MKKIIIMAFLGSYILFSSNIGSFLDAFFSPVKEVHAIGTITGMDVWLKADSGTASSTDGSATGNWGDQSGQGNNYTSVTGPTLQTNELNFNPGVEILSGGFNAPVGAALGNEYSLFFVSKKLASDSNGRLFEAHTGNKLWGYHDIHRNSLYIEANPNNYNSGIAVNDGSHLIPHIFYYDRNTSAQVLARADGGSLATFNSTNSVSGARIDINQGNFSATQHSDAQVYEFMLYDRKLTLTEIGQVESYLALKYGMTLDSSSSSYKNSSGTSVFTYDGTYEHHVVGIGEDTGSSLDQQISKSIEAGSILTLSTDTNFTAANGTHTSLGDGKYVITASNNAATTSQTTEIDTLLYASRISREWKTANIGTVGDINLKFSGFGSNYVLLLDDDGDFSSGVTNVGNLSAIGEISITIADGKYFTLAIPDDTIAPTISSIFPTENKILPIGNFNIDYSYSDNAGGSGIQLIKTGGNIAASGSITHTPATLHGVPPHPASIVNGVKSTSGAFDHEFHSDSTNAFIEFEWAIAKKITDMKIFNRVGCCSERLTNATIELFDSSNTLLYTHTLGSTLGVNTIDIDFKTLGQIHDVKKLRLESHGADTFINIREIEIFEAAEIVKLYKWDGVSSYGSDIAASHIDFPNKVFTTTGATYAVSGLPYGKYKMDFELSDNNGNTTLDSTIFYVDEPELIISTGSLNLGSVIPDQTTFSPTFMLTVKTVGAGFDESMSRSSLFAQGIKFIPSWDGVTGYGYQQAPYTGLISTIGTNQNVATQSESVNINGEKNIYNYEIQIGAFIGMNQAIGDYIGSLDFHISLDY